MNNDDLRRRIEALERRLNAEQLPGSPGAPMRIVIIEGALPPGAPIFANASQHQWLRSEGEDLETFCKNVAAHARELGEPLVVIGGLPQTQEQQDLALAAYDEWAKTDDGVPPCEPPRGVPQ